jgi:spore germination protein YaaH
MIISSINSIVRCLLLVMVGMSWLLPQASAGQIVVKPATGNSLVIPESAIAQAGEVFIPVGVVRDYLLPDVVIDPLENRLYVTIQEDNLRDANLRSLLHNSDKVNFLTRSIANREYISLQRFDLLLGIQWKYDSKTGDLLIEKRKPDTEKSLQVTRKKWTPTGSSAVTWDHIGKYSPDLAARERISGLDVISPTWFRLSAPNGTVINNADEHYVAEAHAQGYRVWPLLTNSFDSKLTHQFFQGQQAQETAIRQLAAYATLYDFDGLNVDFENMEDADAGAFVVFAERLTTELHRQNLIVSADVTVPSNSSYWSLCYDRTKLGAIVDYVMVMTYDEHWSRSPVSGSVASLKWVRAGIDKMLVEVPPQKLLLGIPFYTREWRETAEDTGKITVKSKVLTMEGASERFVEYGDKINWLADAGQYYFEYNKDNSVYKIWMEEARSIRLKAQLVNQYGLAGVACWRQGFENPDIWPTIEEVLKVPERKVVTKKNTL